MKLYNCRSDSLLPRFARNAFTESLCGAIDELVRALAVRCDALPCENSAASLAACRDDELAQIAEDLGVVPYYPDLPRTTRETMILQAKTWTRYAGTSGSIIAMVNALFNTDGTVIDDDQPDAYHYLIDITDNFVGSTEINFRRFNECLEKLGHTTTTPDGFIFRYEGTCETNATALSGDVLELYDTDGLCEYPEERTLEVLLAVYMNRYTGEYLPYSVGVSNKQNGGPITQEDKERIEAFGLQLSGHIGAYGTPPYGCIVWDDNYTFEPIALYTDINGEQLDTNGNAADMSNFECVKTNNWVYIKMKVQENKSSNHSPATMTWKLRITKNN